MENYDNNNFTHTHTPTFLWVSTDTEVENNYIYTVGSEAFPPPCLYTVSDAPDLG